MGQLNFAPRVESDMERIGENDDLTGRDKELLARLKRDMKLDDNSYAHIHKVLTHLNLMGERLSGGFEDATEEDIKDVVEWVKDKDVSHVTKQHYKKALKRFYKWLNDGEYPEKVEWINTTVKKKNRKLPEKMLNKEDILALKKAANNPRDRALVSVLWDSGARIGEIIDLKVGDLEEWEHGKKAVINGKTGSRRVYFSSSDPDINNWLSNHPRGDDPEAPLWCKISGESPGKKRVGYRYILKALNTAADGAGIDKPVNPHHFRHSRATFFATRFTESTMCQWFWWVQGSDRPADYVHLSGRDVESAIKDLHGIDDDGDEPEDPMTPQKCPRCHANNGADAKFCQRCGLALDKKSAMEKEKKQALGNMIIEKMEEMDAEGTIEELFERAMDAQAKEVLKG